MKFSHRTRDPAIAKLRAGFATAQFERYSDGLRKGSRPLTHKHIIALSGIVYREQIVMWEDDPGNPESWEMAAALTVDATDDPRQLEKSLGPIVDELLAREGIRTDRESRRRLLMEAARPWPVPHHS